MPRILFPAMMVTAIRIFLPARQSEFFHPQNGNESPNQSMGLQFQLILCCNRDGVLWRGLYPLLSHGQPMIKQCAMKVILDRFIPFPWKYERLASKAVAMNGKLDASDMREMSSRTHEGFLMRQLLLVTENTHKKRNHVDVLLLPPQITHVQRLFAGCLIRYERLVMSLQCLSAYFATLGGGYFLCRNFPNALKLAKQQRCLALWMGDQTTADKCTLNEAFTYIQSGRFGVAQAKIRKVQQSATQRDDKSTLHITQAAIIFLRRMKRTAKFERVKENFDDFHRIRIIVNGSGNFRDKLR